jgi:hypothetical protein
VRFARPDLVSDEVLTVYGSDADGWIHVQIKLSALVDAATLKLGASSSSGAGYFNRIVFKDISGGLSAYTHTVWLLVLVCPCPLLLSITCTLDALQPTLWGTHLG